MSQTTACDVPPVQSWSPSGIAIAPVGGVLPSAVVKPELKIGRALPGEESSLAADVTFTAYVVPGWSTAEGCRRSVVPTQPWTVSATGLQAGSRHREAAPSVAGAFMASLKVTLTHVVTGLPTLLFAGVIPVTLGGVESITKSAALGSDAVRPPPSRTVMRTLACAVVTLGSVQ